jgi:hypothetical protein
VEGGGNGGEMPCADAMERGANEIAANETVMKTVRTKNRIARLIRRRRAGTV